MIGTKLGNRYELLQQIGEGGMAVVYKAKCHFLNRFVAIKILKDQFSNDIEFVEKFKKEATSVASLSDNNIVNIYDVGSQENIHYIVMEYVKGKTLKEYINQHNKINNKEAINIAIQIANALICAHKNNIIHRDIKPHNILITDEGIIKVTDFGIAKASNSSTITNSSKVMGSAHYFSPEQAKGSYVDLRTDIYSLGIVMYEMVTGKVPFDAESPVSVALKHIQETPISPRDINSDVSQDLNNLILKCLEKNPIKRYSNVKELLEDLTKIKNNESLGLKSNISENDMTRVMDTTLINEQLKKIDKKNYDDYEDYDEEEDEEEEVKIKNPKKHSKNKKVILGIALGVLILVIGSVSAFFASNSKNGSNVLVPNIIGMTKEEAEKALSDKKLKLTVAQKVKSDKKEGTIVESYPSTGTKVKENSEIRVTISGGNVMTVPNLKNMSLEHAKQMIENSKLKLGSIQYEYNDYVNSGRIITQTPDSDSEVKEGAEISLIVSNGPKIKYANVPNVVGKSLQEAQNDLSNAGLSLGNTSTITTDDQSLDGKVSSQSVSPGSSIKQGNSVGVTYYKYKKVEVKPEPKEKVVPQPEPEKDKIKPDVKPQPKPNQDKVKPNNQDNQGNKEDQNNKDEQEPKK